MSNVYILEPPTSGKVLLKTTVGEIEIELWAKETPKTCRNFIQLCLEGYYNGTTFHRVVKGFIAQGGDPTGDGTGGESIYGGTFKDEFHQRLRFSRRGLLGMANAGPDDNASQFFFTLAATPELQNKHTIFGKVTGETIFNMLKFEEGLIEDERPVYPHKILKTEVLHNPFPDIEPRVLEPVIKESKRKKKDKTPGVKNFKLLSFGAEAEEDEEESSKVNEKYAGKGKSTHDVLDDPKLSSETLDQPEGNKSDKDKVDENSESEESDDPAERLANIRKKLKPDKKEKKLPPVTTTSYYDEDESDKRKRKFEEIKKEIDSVKREYHQNKLKRTEEIAEEKKEAENQETFKEYKDEFKKYKTKTKELPKKGAGREAFTLELLNKFKKKLSTAKDSRENAEEEKKSEEEDDIDDDNNWLAHKLHFKSDTPVLAKDANTKDDDWFEIYDPRNPLNKRRREASAKSSKK